MEKIADRQTSEPKNLMYKIRNVLKVARNKSYRISIVSFFCYKLKATNFKIYKWLDLYFYNWLDQLDRLEPRIEII